MNAGRRQIGYNLPFWDTATYEFWKFAFQVALIRLGLGSPINVNFPWLCKDVLGIEGSELEKYVQTYNC